jgi:hypothetical protein
VPGVAAYERNESLGIQNRLLASFGGGRWLVESNRQTLVALAGLAGNLEDTVGEGGGQTSLEGFAGGVYGTYDSQPPEGALQTSDYGLVTSIGYSFWP